MGHVRVAQKTTQRWSSTVEQRCEKARGVGSSPTPHTKFFEVKRVAPRLPQLLGELKLPQRHINEGRYFGCVVMKVTITSRSCVVSNVISARDNASLLPTKIQKVYHKTGVPENFMILEFAHRTREEAIRARIENPNNILSIICRFSTRIFGAKTSNNDFVYVDGRIYRRVSFKELKLSRIGSGLKWIKNNRQRFLVACEGKLGEKDAQTLDAVVLETYDALLEDHKNYQTLHQQVELEYGNS